MKKSKIGTIIVIFITLVLAGVAIFTAIRLYQLRQTSVSPISPSSEPAAQEAEVFPANNLSCVLDFSLTASTSSPSPTATATASPTATPVPTPTPTPVAQCNSSCTSNSQCQSDLFCYIAAGATTGNCRNTSCQTDTDCVCATPTARASATPAPELPDSGTDWPTIAGFGLGIFVILGSLLLAL